MNGTRHGALAALGPVLLILLAWFYGEVDPLGRADLRPRVTPVGVGLSLLLGGAGALGSFWPRIARAMAATALLGFLAAAGPALAPRPALALAYILAGLGLLAWFTSQPLARRGLLTRGRAAHRAAGAAGGACLGASAVWLVAVAFHVADDPLAWRAAYFAQGTALAIGWVWALRRRDEHPRRLVWLSTAAVVGIAVALAAAGPAPAATALWLATLPVGLAAWHARRAGPSPLRVSETWWDAVLEDPARMLVVTFLACGVLGGLLLSLPACGTGPIQPIDAFFTSFSATCVTGLAVLDTPRDFTGLGQAVILLLIQVGGLGIMTFSTAAFVLLGRRMSLRHEGAVSELLLSQEDRGALHAAIRQLFLFTCAAELVGALGLTLLFLRGGEALGPAAWKGVFTSISAFCNAGFALDSASLVDHQRDPATLQLVGLLIVLGGLGPAVLAAGPHLLRRRRTGLQTRLTLVTTAILLVSGALAFAIIEWNNTLRGLSFLDRLSNAWFQSVTLRTAGFNSVDLAAARPATITLMMAFMFVGGSSGSTAGGVKVSTLAVLVLAVFAAVRGRSETSAFGYRIAQGSIYKAVAIVALGVASVIAALLAIQLTQPMDALVATFEVVSALGTVGLSIGGTGQLDSVGKVIIIACMFAGRVGPITLFVLIARRSPTSVWQRPEQPVAVG